LNITGLLSFMLGATETTIGPDVAPEGMVITMAVALHELTVTVTSLSKTTLLPCTAPKPEPKIATWPPTDPVVAERFVITGADEAAEPMDTLSNVAVSRVEPPALATTNPTYTFCAIVTV
jgi:hypothetical protein